MVEPGRSSAMRTVRAYAAVATLAAGLLAGSNEASARWRSAEALLAV
jgi:hypothetical protein